MALHSIFSPGDFHGQRSLAGNSPWGHQESDTTEETQHACMHTHPNLEEIKDTGSILIKKVIWCFYLLR